MSPRRVLRLGQKSAHLRGKLRLWVLAHDNASVSTALHQLGAPALAIPMGVPAMAVLEPHLQKDKARDAEERPSRGRRWEARTHALPYEIRMNDALAGRFDDLRDAAASARIAKGAHPDANIIIADAVTRRLIIEIVE